MFRWRGCINAINCPKLMVSTYQLIQSNPRGKQIVETAICRLSCLTLSGKTNVVWLTRSDQMHSQFWSGANITVLTDSRTWDSRRDLTAVSPQPSAFLARHNQPKQGAQRRQSETALTSYILWYLSFSLQPEINDEWHQFLITDLFYFLEDLLQLVFQLIVLLSMHHGIHEMKVRQGKQNS